MSVSPLLDVVERRDHRCSLSCVGYFLGVVVLPRLEELILERIITRCWVLGVGSWESGIYGCCGCTNLKLNVVSEPVVVSRVHSFDGC